MTEAPLAYLIGGIREHLQLFWEKSMEGGSTTLFLVSIGLILSCVIVITLFIVYVHTMPGKIAEKRGNPQAKAIEITSLLGLLVFPLWMAALIWSYLKPFTVPVAVVDGVLTPQPEDNGNNKVVDEDLHVSEATNELSEV